MVITQEKGASSWLTTLPISEHGFALHKGAFRDALGLRYGCDPPNTPSHCGIGGKSFTVEHALSCPFRGFPTLRHNEIWNLTANLLSEVLRGKRVWKNACIQLIRVGVRLIHGRSYVIVSVTS